MGSGDRIKFYRIESFGFGFSLSRFPFSVTLYLHALIWSVSIGFGKGYDE